MRLKVCKRAGFVYENTLVLELGFLITASEKEKDMSAAAVELLLGQWSSYSLYSAPPLLHTTVAPGEIIVGQAADVRQLIFFTETSVQPCQYVSGSLVCTNYRLSFNPAPGAVEKVTNHLRQGLEWRGKRGGIQGGKGVRMEVKMLRVKVSSLVFFFGLYGITSHRLRVLNGFSSLSVQAAPFQ